MLVGCFPLCRFFFPVVALWGGGKSGFRRVDLHLDRLFVGDLTKAIQGMP